MRPSSFTSVTRRSIARISRWPRPDTAAFWQSQPDNALALNNVAWIMAKRKDPGALAFAQQASRLQPDRPEFMDTQAGILVQDRQFDKAIALQKKAIELRPQNYAYQLNLARGLCDGGLQGTRQGRTRAVEPARTEVRRPGRSRSVARNALKRSRRVQRPPSRPRMPDSSASEKKYG